MSPELEEPMTNDLSPATQAWLASLPDWVGTSALAIVLAAAALVLVGVARGWGQSPPPARVTHLGQPCERCGAVRGTPSYDVFTCGQVRELQRRLRESADRMHRQHTGLDRDR